MKGNILEAILIFIAIILISFLVWNHFNYLNEVVMLEHEYDYNAIKIITTENTIATVKYMAKGNPVKYLETIYVENGKISKIVNEEQYSNINSAKVRYDWTINHSSMDSKTVSIKSNVVSYTNINPEVSWDNLITVNELFDYAEENLAKDYPEFTRVY
jgi:hypothetical protein